MRLSLGWRRQPRLTTQFGAPSSSCRHCSSDLPWNTLTAQFGASRWWHPPGWWRRRKPRPRRRRRRRPAQGAIGGSSPLTSWAGSLSQVAISGPVRLQAQADDIAEADHVAEAPPPSAAVAGITAFATFAGIAAFAAAGPAARRRLRSDGSIVDCCGCGREQADDFASWPRRRVQTQVATDMYIR